MGLDNLPTPRPCEGHDPVRTPRAWTMTEVDTGDSEVELAVVIDCAATADAGRCPWATADRPGLPALGIGGQPCWLRGGAIQPLIDRVVAATAPSDAAGDDVLYDDLSPAQARTVAEWMDGADSTARRLLDEDDYARWVYASWWLRWCADHDASVTAWS